VIDGGGFAFLGGRGVRRQFVTDLASN
jgi:hypothetical protein